MGPHGSRQDQLAFSVREVLVAQLGLSVGAKVRHVLHWVDWQDTLCEAKSEGDARGGEVASVDGHGASRLAFAEQLIPEILPPAEEVVGSHPLSFIMPEERDKVGDVGSPLIDRGRRVPGAGGVAIE